MNKSRILSNLVWRLLERFGAQTVTLVVSIVLARLLEPEMYGTVAIVSIFITLFSVFIDSGFGSSLIQKKASDDTDFSTVFYLNVFSCFILYCILFFASPIIAYYYGDAKLIIYLRVSGISLLISGLRNVQGAYIAKKMMYKKLFFSSLAGTLGAAIIGIYLALHGYGVWALIIQGLFNTTLDTIILWITVGWRPRKIFSFNRLKGLFSYGWKLLVSSLLDTAYNNIRSLIIGRVYGSEDLAYYNKGQTWPNLLITNINASIDSVLFPSMSGIQDRIDELKKTTQRAIKVSTFIITPIMVGIGVCADSLVAMILTEKWLPCVFYMRVFCFSFAFWPIHTANLNVIKALGRSDIFLRLELIKKIIGIIVVIITMQISVKALALSLVFTSLTSQLINSFPNKKLLGYGYYQQIKDILPQIIISLLMGALILCVRLLALSNLITLILQFLFGMIVYIILSKLFHVDSFDYLLGILVSIKNRNK